MHSRLKIVHVLRSLDIGGAEMIAVKLANWQVARGHEVVLVSGPGALLREVDPRISLIPLRRTGVLYMIWALWKQTRESRRTPTILHAHQRREALAAWLIDGVSGASAVEHAHTELPTQQFKAASFRSRHVFAVSDAVATQVREVFGRRGPVSVVDNVPGAKADPRPPELWGGRAEETLKVGGIGRISEQKDPWRFVEVMQELGKLTHSVKCSWAGGGEGLAELRDRDDDVRVDFVGQISDVAGFLRNQHVLVLTSRWEGLPLVALEALAAGIPVVATSVGGLPSLLTDSGAGVCVPEDAAPNPFARAIIEASCPGPSRAQRIATGLKMISERFSADAAFEPIEATYNSLLGVRA